MIVNLHFKFLKKSILLKLEIIFEKISFVFSKISILENYKLDLLKKIKARDRIDMIGENAEKNSDGKRALKRVMLERIVDISTKSDRPKVVLITWKSGLFEDDAYKA